MLDCGPMRIDWKDWIDWMVTQIQRPFGARQMKFWEAGRGELGLGLS